VPAMVEVVEPGGERHLDAVAVRVRGSGERDGRGPHELIVLRGGRDDLVVARKRRLRVRAGPRIERGAGIARVRDSVDVGRVDPGDRPLGTGYDVVELVLGTRCRPGELRDHGAADPVPAHDHGDRLAVVVVVLDYVEGVGGAEPAGLLDPLGLGLDGVLVDRPLAALQGEPHGEGDPGADQRSGDAPRYGPQRQAIARADFALAPALLVELLAVQLHAEDVERVVLVGDVVPDLLPGPNLVRDRRAYRPLVEHEVGFKLFFGVLTARGQHLRAP